LYGGYGWISAQTDDIAKANTKEDKSNEEKEAIQYYDITAEQSKKIKIIAYPDLSQKTIKIEIYNGSDWFITGIIAFIVAKEADGSIRWKRQYSIKDSITASLEAYNLRLKENRQLYIKPLSDEHTVIYNVSDMFGIKSIELIIDKIWGYKN
jgi:hypothetical protein